MKVQAPERQHAGDSGTIATLLESEEPAIRYRVLAGALGEPETSATARRAQEEIRASPRVARLLSEREEHGRIPGSPYQKFTGAHWVLALLADIGYPPGDASLAPLRDQVYDCWLSPRHIREHASTGAGGTARSSILTSSGCITLATGTTTCSSA